MDFDSTQQQINVVQAMTIVLFMRLPIISVLMMELPDILVIVETTKTMASPFLSILFSVYLFMETYCIVGQALYSGCVTFNDMRTIQGTGGNALYYQLNFNDTVSGLLMMYCVLCSN